MNYPKEFFYAVSWCCEKDLFNVVLSKEDKVEVWNMAMRLLNKNQDCLDTQNGWNELVYDAMLALDYELPETDAI